ncbi:SpoIIE family protein phosphatase [Kitasatospora aureofaciens]|uniref:SpoIIE family protein phosphatase n=1 Tax=Kitasatospora aureofaciens TaxID=1894 RepID=UPI0022771A19|nr:SpoIIE family protein phosphatase [Kitasatospora aureofaciens]
MYAPSAAPSPDSGQPLGVAGFLYCTTDPYPPQVHTLHLQPHDRVLLFTDGVTEARSASGELFLKRPWVVSCFTARSARLRSTRGR